ncbi:hypothetical protein CJO88_05675 [Ralstonia solanacearum]|nr:hypothetical protein CJO88_05675 [Ralstonia solanacearum]
MNPRVFCRERGYHKAILLTFSFDPIFFEQVVLPDLWVGQSRDILVLGDRGQTQPAVQSAAGHLWHLGKRYLLAPAHIRGAFHPKVFLRLGPRDGIVMIGSGNVTSSGWGGNQELGTAWMIGPDHPDRGGWLHPFFKDVQSWCDGELERNAVSRMTDVPWLSLTPAASIESGPMLYSHQTHALAPALARRWAGRRFEELKILTGSTDESGAFLRWAHATFGIRRATVAVTPSSASFVAERLADLPLELRLIAAPPLRPLHAKFYWFAGADGAAAVMGSANCSAAAWLLTPLNGGNIESVVVYDRAVADEFEHALNLFLAPSHTPAEILLPRPAQEAEPAARQQRFALRSLQWEKAGRHIYAEIDPVPEPDATIELEFEGRRVSMSRCASTGVRWTCNLADDLDAATRFASVVITIGAEVWATAPRWVDDIAALEHASHAARLLEPFKGFHRDTTSQERRKMLDDLQEIAQALFSDRSSFPDPRPGANEDQKKGDAPAAPVDPNDLVSDLDDSDRSSPFANASRPGSLSLTGILRLLFDAEVEDDTPAPPADGDDNLDDGQMPMTSHDSPTEQDGDLGKGANGLVVEARFRDRLAEQIQEFLTGISAAAFAGGCTATQMVQAASFPLAVALCGQQKGWVKDDLAERWAQEVFSILFRRRYDGVEGLLRVVERRYLERSQIATFNDVVGDGTLWLILVATLGGANWQGVGADIDKAVVIREVFSSTHLRASAQRARVAELLGKIRIENGKAYIASVAPAVTRLLGELESTLRPFWEAEKNEQGTRGIAHRPGNLLWRDRVGWAVCLSEARPREGSTVSVRLWGVEKVVMADFYVNVSEVCDRQPRLGQLLDALRATVMPVTHAGELVFHQEES